MTCFRQKAVFLNTLDACKLSKLKLLLNNEYTLPLPQYLMAVVQNIMISEHQAHFPMSYTGEYNLQATKFVKLIISQFLIIHCTNYKQINFRDKDLRKSKGN